MSFYFSKSKFISTYSTCNKYAWLDKNKPQEKTKPDEFTESLFNNGHIVGALAKQRFNVEADVSTQKEDGSQDNVAMLEKTKKHIAEGKKIIAEASFSYNGLFCSVDILKINNDGSYTIYEVKSSKIKNKKETGCIEIDTGRYTKEKYITDAAYQQYVIENYGKKVKEVNVVLLSNSYVRGDVLELDKYFEICNVTSITTEKQPTIKNKLAEIDPIINSKNEPASVFTANCKNCEYFGYCAKAKVVPTPSVFDIYGLDFDKKCNLYNNGITFFDAPKHEDLCDAALKQIEYYNKKDCYVDKAEVKKFLDSLKFPLYSLDFETYQAIVPEYKEMKISENIPFQYSLHIMKVPNGEYSEDSAALEEKHFIDISGGDPRRAIAESLVKDIPFGACIIACHEGTERNIIKRLADIFPDLEKHLLSYGYKNIRNEDRYIDIQPLFQNGYYYSSKMGNSFSLKSILPALYPDEAEMDYNNLEGKVKNGTQVMMAMSKIKNLSDSELVELEEDLIKYCALDTLAVVKIIKKLYEVI